MQSRTPRPESTPEAPENAAGGDEGESRGARRDSRAALSAATNLKLLERRAQAARETSTRRDESAKPPTTRPAGGPETRRSAEPPLVHTSEARRRITISRRIQLALAGVGLASLGLLAVPLVPSAVPIAILCACLLATVYLGQVLTRPLASLADTARAVVLGDQGARATVEAGELTETARALNSLLDERAALVAQNSEQQQRLQNDIHHLATVVGAAATGDLSPRAKVQGGSLGKLADEINAALDAFEQLAHGVRAASGTMLETLAEAHDLTQSLHHNVSRQGNGLESSSGVLRHVAERTEAVNENATVATDAARRAGETAQEGGRLLNRLLEGMLNARRNAQGSAAKVKRLGERAMEISTIVGAISRISAQTNMLALNAAIEASRAGEHGLGFTVVADEVRKLAEDCEEATREIARLITAIQAETNDAVTDLERQAGQVEQQTQLASDAGSALDRILSVSQQSTKLVSEISEAAHQQAGDTAGLREAMQNAGLATREMQAVAERAQRTIEALNATANELSRRVAAYRGEGTANADVTQV